MQEIFEENQSKILHGAIVWTPMLMTDNVYAANEREARFSDPRVVQFWDPDRIIGQLLSKTLKLRALIAWDMYLVYPPEHPWDAELPPMPAFWMHQLDEEPTLFLDPLRLKRAVQAMIAGVKHE